MKFNKEQKKLLNKKVKKKQINNLELLIQKLIKNPIHFDDFLNALEHSDETFFDCSQLEFELLISNGLPIDIINNKVVLKTSQSTISEQIFCIVDIETNGNDTQNGQIIEIAGIKYQNGHIIDKYESLVYAKNIPIYIQEITNIKPIMLKDAPVLQVVLEEFKIFLEDSVFIAHNIKFDYKFISDSFIKYDLGKLENRKLCTIDLAKRTIKSDKYGLSSLKTLLNINLDNHHRAYSDALSTTYILEECIKQLPKNIATPEDLIKYSKSDNIIKNDIK